jgi:LmbE family N-acetylglucosaminyl deacetylase
VVVSPHLDDGVFGCGAALAHRPGSVVVTVFAGRPDPGFALTRWDAAAGFAAGDDVIAARRAEDAAALAEVGARPIWLDFRDSQYGRSPTAGEIAAALDAVVASLDARVVLVPLGLYHSDHALVHDAALAVLALHADRRWLLYADAMYRRLPGLTATRLARMERAGLAPQRATLASTPDDQRRKRAGVHCYRSQLRALASLGLPGRADTDAPEEFWSVRRG